MSLNIVHSFYTRKQHRCIVVLQLWPRFTNHLDCTNGCAFLSCSLLILPPSLLSFLSSFISPLSSPLFFTFCLSKLSCEAQTLITGSTALKGCLFQPSQARQMQLRRLASYLHWGRCQQEQAESSLALLSLPGDGTGLTSGNTEFLASGIEFSL